MDVPELVTRGDRAEADRWREARRTARFGLGSAQMGPVALALVTDGRFADVGERLSAAGADLVGLLAPEPLESLAWAAAAGARRAYPDLRSLLADEVEAVCVDLDLPAAGAVSRSCAHAGVHLVLTRPPTDDPELLRDLVDAAQNFDVDVTAVLAIRAWPTLPVAQQMLPPLGALRQVTVVGWPIGRQARMELVDLVRQLCGDVLAVCAAPAAMPASDLRPGEPVTLALLTSSGATVLVAERPGTDLEHATVTVIGTDGRLVLGSDYLRRQDARGVAASSVPEGAARSALAVALSGLETSDSWDRRNGVAATVGDLLAASRVLEVASGSFDAGGWLEI
ncbi:MAG TPA: Gfo/Idh/MocA family oxidoreductase [Frankiaceae bacterium]|nr:Gfo/Idh/MocA family oxidoreductase [Frankiaceae bacterium]